MSNWKIGQTVQAGFMTAVVRAELLDSVFILSNPAGTQLYKFVPHGGVHKISIELAKGLIRDDQIYRHNIQERVAATQAQRAAVDAVFA